MKKLLPLFVCFLVILNTKAQIPSLVSYPPMGLIQGEVYYGGMYDPIFHNTTIRYIKDTVISSITYSYFTTNYDNLGYYTRYSNGKIYYAARNVNGTASAEVLKYDFALLVGNTINLQFVGNLTVDSVVSITLLNGQVRKYIRLRNSLQQKIEWIDGIGDINNGFLYQHGIEGEYNKFICTRDNSGMLYKKSNTLDCDSLTGYTVGMNEMPIELGLSISPNPTYNIINLESQNVVTTDVLIQVSNTFGQLVFSNKLIKGTSMVSIDLTPFNSGIYYLELKTAKGLIRKKIVKE